MDRRRARSGLPVLLAMLLFVGLLAWTSAKAEAPGVAIVTQNDLFFVLCAVNDIDERCQLDTGDNTTATLRPTPAFSKLPVLKAGRTMGVAGVALDTSLVRIGQLSAGDMTLDQPDGVQVLAQPHPYSSLGLGFFMTLGAATFDFRGARLSGAGPDPGHRCPDAFQVTNMVIVPGALSGRPIRMGWDTGANRTVADSAFVAAHPELFTFVRDLADGADATRMGLPARLFLAKRIALCGRTFDDMPVVAIDLSAPKAAIPGFPDMVLGANLMIGQIWAFDFKSRAWSFTP